MSNVILDGFIPGQVLAEPYNNITMKGTWLAPGTVTLPNFIAGGDITFGTATLYGGYNQRLEINEAAASEYGGIALNNWSATANRMGALQFTRAKSGTIGTYTAAVSGEWLGLISFNGADGTDFQQSGYIGFKASGTVANNRVPGTIEFHCYSDAAPSVDTTVLTITAAGVGAHTLTGELNMGGYNIIACPEIHSVNQGNLTLRVRADSTYRRDLLIQTDNASGVAVTRLTITGGVATSVATWATVTHTGFVLTASEKINPASGVAGFSVVSTALTLGSLGSVIIPQSAANATDALAGNLAGAICIDLTSTTERLYFRGASAWFYIAKTGGLSMTEKERIDPTGHRFEVGDTVKLVVDRINVDGSFHASPRYQK